MYQLFSQLLVYFIYFVVALALWHYGVPKKVKKEVKRLLGIFFRWLLFGRRPEEKKKKEEKPVSNPRVEEFSWKDIEDAKKTNK